MIHKTRPTHIKLMSMVMWASVCMTSMVIAQPMRMSVEDRVKRLKEQLTLTDAQADSVKKIYTEVDAKRSEIFAASSSNRSAMREQMQKLTNDTDVKIEALLTAEQKEKYEKIKKERPAMGQGRRTRSQ